MTPGQKLQQLITERLGTVAEFGRRLQEKHRYKAADRVARDWVVDKKFGPKQWVMAATVLGVEPSFFAPDGGSAPSDVDADDADPVPSRAQFIADARAADDLTADEELWLRSQRFDGWDPGDDFWAGILVRYRRAARQDRPSSPTARTDLGAEALERVRQTTGFKPKALKLVKGRDGTPSPPKKR